MNTKWKPGQSGNPKGKTPGTGKIKMLRSYLEPAAPKLIQTAVELALSGDVHMLRLLIDKLLPDVKPVATEGLNLTQQPSVVVYLPQQDALPLDD